MKSIDTRINRLENVVNPNTPHVIVAFSEEEADEKVREYEETHPGSGELMVITVNFIDSPKSQER
jgi:hypothetical protein